jgi:hypothetical protein
VSPSYKGHRYPVEIISHCVWLYFRVLLSFREVEELMLQGGVIVSHETGAALVSESVVVKRVAFGYVGVGDASHAGSGGGVGMKERVPR